MSEWGAVAQELQELVTSVCEELEVPGLAAGIVVDGEDHVAFHGVTSIENPLPVDARTLFQFGSTGKTYTATAVLRLVERGDVQLDAPVRRYLPELALRDEDVAERVTVLQLLNHTAGWQGDLMTSTGEGDDALERYVGLMKDLVQETPLGSVVSYNNASLSVAGLLIARITGSTYEQAIHDLLLEPIGMTDTLFFPTDVMTRRFAVGHHRHPDGRIEVQRPWAMPRGNAPAGGMSATVVDQLTWARFHLAGGVTRDGTRVLSRDLVELMQVPTARMDGSALGDAVGISWLLRETDGIRLVGHGGTTHGQHSDFLMAPERGFAVTSLANSGPNGPVANHRIQRWALERFLGIKPSEPKPRTTTPAERAELVGNYSTIAAVVEVRESGEALEAAVRIRPEVADEMGLPEDQRSQPPFKLAMLDGSGDRFEVTAEGNSMLGYFARDDAGGVVGIHLGGRLAVREGALQPA